MRDEVHRLPLQRRRHPLGHLLGPPASVLGNLEADERSILSLYKALIALRKKLPQLMSGDYVPIAAQGELLLYRRQSEGKAVVIALNLGAEPISLTSNSADLNGEILLSTSLDREGEKITGALDLRGNEGVIVGAHAG